MSTKWLANRITKCERLWFGRPVSYKLKWYLFYALHRQRLRFGESIPAQPFSISIQRTKRRKQVHIWWQAASGKYLFLKKFYFMNKSSVEIRRLTSHFLKFQQINIRHHICAECANSAHRDNAWSILCLRSKRAFEEIQSDFTPSDSNIFVVFGSPPSIALVELRARVRCWRYQENTKESKCRYIMIDKYAV